MIRHNPYVMFFHLSKRLLTAIGEALAISAGPSPRYNGLTCNKAGGVLPGLVFSYPHRVMIPRRTASIQYSRDRPTDAQLAIDTAHRMVDRPLGHTKPVGNLLDLVPVSEQPQEIHLATGELVVESSPTLKPSARYPRADHHFAHRHVTDNRTDKQRVVVAFRHVSPRPCLKDAMDSTEIPILADFAAVPAFGSADDAQIFQ